MRIATFNVENLFDRPKILNLEDTAESSRLLAKVDKLNTLLKLKSYTDATKAKILDLYEALKGYIDIQEDVGKLFKKSGTKIIGVQASGAVDWYGGIQFKRKEFTDKQRSNTGFLIKQINADIQCLVEVEGNQALNDFNSEILKRRFSIHLSIDSPRDPRGIDLGVYGRGAHFGNIRTNAFDKEGNSFIWSRDCLEVEFILPSGKSLYMLANHLKSKLTLGKGDSDERRMRQAERLVEILEDRYDLKKDYVIVAGDFNDTPDSAPMKKIGAVKNLTDVFDLSDTPLEDRWTYYYKKKRTQIDYLFASEALAQKFTGVELFRRGMTAVAKGEIPEISPYPQFDGFSTAASDHAAIAADFDIA